MAKKLNREFSRSMDQSKLKKSPSIFTMKPRLKKRLTLRKRNPISSLLKSTEELRKMWTKDQVDQQNEE